MKQTFSLIIMLLTLDSVNGQNLDYQSYVNHEFEVFSSIDSNYLKFLKEQGVKSLTETRSTLDSLGDIQKSQKLFHYNFDTLGRIIEKRFDYRHDSLFRWTNYNYESEDSVVKEYNDPFGTDGILTGIYVPDNFYSHCEQRNDRYQMEFIEVQAHKDEKLKTMSFKYYENQIIVDRNRPKRLLQLIEYSDIQQNTFFKHMITYERFEE